MEHVSSFIIYITPLKILQVITSSCAMIFLSKYIFPQVSESFGISPLKILQVITSSCAMIFLISAFKIHFSPGK